MNPWLTRFWFFGSLLAFCVVALGAYVRLHDAGLGCPDWPGCYGKMIVPEEASPGFGDARPLEPPKAWREMIHRYLAGVLGLCVLGMAVASAWAPSVRQRVSLGYALFVLSVVVFQALLGMGTVTLRLHPLVVMAHLMGGFALLALLWWMTLGCYGVGMGKAPLCPLKRGWVIAGIAVLTAQIMLGGWTSANYAAMACPRLPFCPSSWASASVLAEAFQLRPFNMDYEFGVLSMEARQAIHMLHRMGALATFLYLAGLGIAVARTGHTRMLRRTGAALAAAVGMQVALGAANILLAHPLSMAVAHNAGAAVLLLLLLTLVKLLSIPTAHNASLPSVDQTPHQWPVRHHRPGRADP